MGLTYHDLSLIRYVQEKQTTTLQDVANRFQKSTASIRREVELINLYSTKPLIEIRKSKCHTKMNYQDYATFVQSITLSDYSSTQQERMNTVIVMMYFSTYVNTSKLYERWGLSLTTKKQDMFALRAYLKKHKLSLISLHKKGLYIAGDQFRYRLLVIQILYPLFDLDEQQCIHSRITNTPFETMNYAYMEQIKSYLPSAFTLMNQFLKEYQLSITTVSKKFLLLFICFMKQESMKSYDVTQLSLPLIPMNLYFCDDEQENRIYNIVLYMLDFSEYLEFPFDQKLWDLTTTFVFKIIECLTSTIYTKQALIEECYGYFYKQIMLSHFHLKLVDKLVKNTKEQLPLLYEIIQKYTGMFVDSFQMDFFDEQYTTLTFLFQKSIIRNRIVNKNGFDDKKKVVIVSNSSYERIQYFMSQVKEHVEVSFIAMITPSELYRLENVTYDYIFSLSERIFHMLKSQNLPVIQVNYFLNNQDIERLVLYGFHRIKTKFLTKDFVKNICQMSEGEMEEFLKTKYSDYFI